MSRLGSLLEMRWASEETLDELLMSTCSRWMVGAGVEDLVHEERIRWDTEDNSVADEGRAARIRVLAPARTYALTMTALMLWEAPIMRIMSPGGEFVVGVGWAWEVRVKVLARVMSGVRWDIVRDVGFG